MLEWPEMSGEKYFLEAWLSKGVYKPEFFELADIPHAHITFVRPFTIPESEEENVKKKIIDYCKGKKPIPFTMVGEGDFGGDINYIPVKGVEIEEFDNGIEALLENDVQFAEKLGKKKILHLTITPARQSPLPKTELFMLRLTCIRDKQIRFSFDFVTQETLDRDESLDEAKWSKSLKIFTEQNSQK